MIETREAALCVIRRDGGFLVAELVDPLTGLLVHRPPGGGVEEGETPEQAVRRELMEELGVGLANVQSLGVIDHTWYWKGREVRERAWVFLAETPIQGDPPDITEADGERHKTLWRPIDERSEGLPPLCPSTLLALLLHRVR